MLRPATLAVSGLSWALAMTGTATLASDPVPLPPKKEPAAAVVDEVPPPRGRPGPAPPPAPLIRQSVRVADLDVLVCIRHWESRGDYEAVSRDGRYFGAFQFDVPTWRGAVARAGFGEWAMALPSEAPPEVQDAAGAQLYRERGFQPWPTPSRRC